MTAFKFLIPILYLCFQNNSVFCAKLNTPRVLLAQNFGGSKNNYTLVVSNGGCYQWSSSRSDLVELTPIHPECSTRAIVSAVSGASLPQIAIITAEDSSHNQVLRCDVVVDVVHTLEIVTTSRQLFLGDAPTLIEVNAKNDQGDTFTSLHGVEFEWTLLTTSEDNTLRFLKFSDSSYQPQKYIINLENQGLQGDKILIEGFKTGSSKVRVRLRHPAYMDVKPAEVTLIVVANVVLNPAQDVYLLKDSKIHYKINLIKDGRIYDVPMPSDEYYLEVGDSNIAKLDHDSSNVTAINYGHTHVILKDKNAKAEELKQQLSAGFHVVQPSYMIFHVTPGENWALQELTYYEITLKIFDDRHHRINPSDNLRIEVKFHTKYFKVFQQSENGTYFVVKTLLPGPTKISAEIHGMELEDGSIIRLDPVKVTQEVIIYQSLQVEPSVVLMPWNPVTKSAYSLKLIARGGTGVYKWASENASLATVSYKSEEESKSATVSTLGFGEVKINILDAHSSVFSTYATISIQAVADLEILPTIVETEIGNEVVIPLALYGFEDEGKTRKKIFNLCADVPITVEVVDKTKLEYNPNAVFPAMGAGCRSLAFTCKEVGYSRIYVQYDVEDIHLKTTALIACHKPLKPVYPVRMILLPVGSTAEVAFEGGPRPWPLNKEGHILRLDEEVSSYSSNIVLKDPHRYNRDLHIFRIWCSEIGETVLKLSVGNERTPTNLNPALLTTTIQLACAVPDTLYLRPVVKGPDGKKLPCPIGDEPTQIPIQNYKDLEIDIWAKDKKGRKFANLTSLDIRWDISDHTKAKLDSIRDVHSQADGSRGYKKLARSFRTVHPVGKEGTFKVTAKIVGYRTDVLKKFDIVSPGNFEPPVNRTVVLDLVDDAVVNPSKVTVFNHATNKVSLNTTKGSGFFYIEVSDPSKAHVEYLDDMRQILVTPVEDGSFTITVHDLCLEVKQLAVVDIQISGVETVVVKMVDKVQLNKSVIAMVQVLGSDMLPLASSLYPLLSLVPFHSSSVISTKLHLAPTISDPFAHYAITGTALGQTSLVFKIEPSNNTTKGYSGNPVSSDPVPIQVFSPLRLSPRNITLVVGATFQMVCSGGPEVYSSIEYIIEDRNVATVTTAGILTASKLGHTVLSARVIDFEKSSGKQVLYSQDTATVFVVPLHGIKIHAPLRRLQTGTKMPIYARGLNDEEIPFAFGSALPRLSLRWGLNNTEVVKLENVFRQGNSHRSSGNNFATRVVALKPGQVTITLEIWSTAVSDQQEVQLGQLVFKDEIAVQVFGDLQLTRPDISEGTIVITPNTQLHLKSSRDSFAHVSYKVDADKTKDPIVKLNNKSLLVSGSQTGDATLTITAVDDYRVTQKKTINIKVRSIAYLMVTADTVPRTKEHALSVLPLGWTSVFTVSAHDSVGEEFHALSVQLNFRPSRFDIIHVSEGIGNRTFTVSANERGQAVLKVWDSANPDLADYVPLFVENAIEPSGETVIEGDVLCFSSPLVTTEGQKGAWHSESSSLVIHSTSGVAVATKPGGAIVDYSISESFVTKSLITVSSIKSISIQTSSSTIISNSVASSIPIYLKGDSLDARISGQNCSLDEELLLPTIQPPVKCRITFVGIGAIEIPAEDVFDISAIFDPKSGHYVCRILPVNRISPEKISFLEANLQLNVEHRNGLIRESVQMTFMPAFHVENRKLVLDKPKAIVSIQVTAASRVAPGIVVLPSDLNSLEILPFGSRPGEPNILLISVRLLYCPSSAQQSLLIKSASTKQEVLVKIETCVGTSVPLSNSWTEQIKTITILVGTLAAIYIGFRAVTGPKFDVTTAPVPAGYTPNSPSIGPRLWTVDNSFPSITTPSPHRPAQYSPNTSFSYADYLQPR